MFSDLFGWVGGLLSAIGSFFKHIYEFVLRHIVKQIIGVLITAHGIINGILYPIQKLLRWLWDKYLKYVYPIQHKILEVIQRTRVALALLRLLGVKWAAKLDAILQQIQAWVTTSIQDVVGTLNTAMTYLGLIVDPLMVIRKDFFAATLFSSLAGVKRAAWFGANNPLSATDQQAEQDSATLAYQRAPLATQNPDGTLATSPAYQNVLDESDRSTADYLRRLQ